MWLFLLFVVVAAAVLDMIRYNVGCKGPFRWPFLRDLVRTILHFHDFHDYAIELLRKAKQDHMYLYLGNVTVLGITNPRDVQHLLKDNWKNYAIAKGLRGEALTDLLGDGIFHADGHHWYVQRKHASREFSAHIFRTFMTSEFIEHSQKLSSILSSKQGSIVDLHQLFFKLTLDAFGQIAFGLSFGALDDKPIPFASCFDKAQEISARRIATKPPFLWKLQRYLGVGDERVLRECLGTIDAFVQDLIKERKRSPDLAEKEDLLSKLMSASEADEEVEPSKKHTYLRDMTINFIIAGRDTTACALSWFFYRLARNPDVEQKLLAELETMIEGKRASFDDLNACHYLTACLSETLRLHPSVPFNPKTAIADDQFPNGCVVRKGDSVAYLSYAMGRMKEIWGEDAETFRPERWISEEGKFVREDPCKFVAFQAGPRLCLGLDMAMLEMKTAVSILLPRFKFTLMEEPTYRVGLVLQMKHGLMMRVDGR